MEVGELVREAQAGSVDAFTGLVRRYQAMAFGSAYAALGDFHAAEDATQAAFLAAWRGIATLAEPDRFGGWLRSIVRFECARVRRRRHVIQVPLDGAGELLAGEPEPAEVAERREAHDRILAAIHALPPAEREATILYYIEEYSQRDVAAFLDLPVTTVNNRLRSARKHLKQGRMLTMTRDALDQHGLPGDFAERIGEIVRADGSIIEARFAPDRRPAVLNVVAVDNGSGTPGLTVPVTQHLDGNLIRAIVGTDPNGGRGVARPGMRVTDTATPVSTPLDGETIKELIGTLRRGTVTGTVLESGIKVIDVLSPLPTAGVVGITGDQHAGKMVLVEELVHRLGGSDARLTLLVFIETGQEVGTVQGLAYRTSEAVQVVYLPVSDPTPDALAGVTAALDAVITISRAQAAQQLYPAIDPLRSTSRLLDPSVAGPEPVDTARAIRNLLSDPEQAGETAQLRARVLQRFLTQPFYIAEAFTNRAGASVSRADALAGCRALLDGAGDGLDEAALSMIGTLDEARQG